MRRSTAAIGRLNSRRRSAVVRACRSPPARCWRACSRSPRRATAHPPTRTCSGSRRSRRMPAAQSLRPHESAIHQSRRQYRPQACALQPRSTDTRACDNGGRMKTAGRVLFVLVLLRWTLIFLVWPMRQDTIGSSFLHTISIPFHEAGHVLFAPFGDLISVAGGSLAQVLVPAACAIAFLTTSVDPFGAAVCAWWTGENLLDVAVYVDDARSLNLVLIGGHTGAEVEGHDWERLLQSIGALH